MIRDILSQSVVWLFILALVLNKLIDRELGMAQAMPAPKPHPPIVYKVYGRDSILNHLPQKKE